MRGSGGIKSYLPAVIVCAALLPLVLIRLRNGAASASPAPAAEGLPAVPSSSAAPAASWQLIWADEFDYTGEPNPADWRPDVGGGGWGNGELQYYTAGGNATVTGQCLEIELRAQPMQGSSYTSARLVSTRGWTYGRFEISARLPQGVGTWPAVWMLPTGHPLPGDPWPGCGELDIMENVGFDHGNIHQTIHTGAFNHMNGNQKGGTKYLADVSEQFHLYAMEWLPDSLRFFIDGEEVFSYKPGDYTGDVTTQEWPFDSPFSLILNVAYGGSWGGALGTDDTCLPAVMEIDYVRVYKLERG